MATVYEETKITLLHQESAVVVKIEKTDGSTPGKAGCTMLVCSREKIYGTIGGGELELYCINAALDVYNTKQSYTKEFVLDSSKSEDVSMICGGNATVSFNYITDKTDDGTFTRIFGLDAVKPRAIIFGGGHVGNALCPVLGSVGFDVTIIDDRPEFASCEVHPTAVQCILCDYSDIGKSISINKDDYVIIMTHGHAGDRDVLLQVCRINPKYIGCIGSRKKVAMTHEYLRQNGISEEVIESVHSPIGLPIGGNTPQEIAISIAAEIIQTRYSGTRA